MEMNRIYTGNSAEVLAQIPENTIDLIVTDPPYLVNYRDRDGRSLKNDDNPDGVLPVFAPMVRAMKQNSYAVLNRPLFAGGPEVRILGHGKDEERNTLSRGTARQGGADGVGSREGIRAQIGGNFVDFAESWMQPGQPAHPLTGRVFAQRMSREVG